MPEPVSFRWSLIRRNWMRPKKLLDGHKIIEVKPMKSFNIGIVTTGSEVYYHRIKDKGKDNEQRKQYIISQKIDLLFQIA